MLRYKTKTRPGLVALYDIRIAPSAGAQNTLGGWENLRFSTEIAVYLGNRTR